MFEKLTEKPRKFYDSIVFHSDTKIISRDKTPTPEENFQRIIFCLYKAKSEISPNKFIRIFKIKEDQEIQESEQWQASFQSLEAAKVHYLMALLKFKQGKDIFCG